MRVALVELGRIDYETSVALQDEIARMRSAGEIGDVVLFCEHEPVITLGRGSSIEDLLVPEEECRRRGVAVCATDRGGAVTYHGPGQLVVYPILDLRRYGKDLHAYVRRLEDAVVEALATLGVSASRRQGSTGVWARDGKVASIGIAVRNWISRHGVAVNVSPDVSGFDLIAPCGQPGLEISSVSASLGREASVREFADSMTEALSAVFDIELQTAALPDLGVVPPWLKRPAVVGPRLDDLDRLVSRLGLTTVCREAECPNAAECFARGELAVMILGHVCTRACAFCAVDHGRPAPPDRGEPDAVGRLARELELEHVVLTSVTRDDLPDGGAQHFADTVRRVKRHRPEAGVEVLVPDFRGRWESVDRVIESGPDVFAHDLETVARLYPRVRPGAGYRRSLDVLARASASGRDVVVKSGLIVGLGETEDEVIETLRDLWRAGCRAVTIGQYMRPGPEQLPIAEYVLPGRFARYAGAARELGFEAVASGPFVRSSYRAGELALQCRRSDVGGPAA